MLKRIPASKIMGQDIQLWQVDLAQSTANPEELARTLSKDEQDRAKCFKFVRDRHRFTICRAALRQIIATTLEVDPVALEFLMGPHGKPRLARSDLRFNISHSGPRALIALTQERELGVDIEETRPFDDMLGIARRFFSPSEAERLCALPDPAAVTRAFFECWTRKEAFIKALGDGLSHPLDTFCVTFFPDETVELRISTQASDRWALLNIDAGPGYTAALVFEHRPDGPDCRVVHRRWEPHDYRNDSAPRT
jgi:4'-phosphopantetheinyl transferase